MDIASACGSTLFGLRLYFAPSPVGSGGPRIGGVGVGPVEVGSLWLVGSTAFGSALGGPRQRFAASAVWVGFFPVTSARAIAVTPLKLDGETIRRLKIFGEDGCGELRTIMEAEP
jgi:hypothetical protein